MTQDPRLITSLPRGITLRDPLLMSSGCWEFSELLRPGKPDPRTFGGAITKAVTPEERPGNPGLRIMQTEVGWLNSVGLKNPGIDRFNAEQLPKLLELGIGFFVNIAGHCEGDFAELISRIEERLAELNAPDTAGEGIGMLGYEINLSCPNVDGANIATVAHLVEQTVTQCRATTQRFITAKLSPNVTDIVEFARAARESGADAVTIANTYNGVSIDTATRASRFARPRAGYSGAAVLPLTLYHIWNCHRALPELPIFGSGGITDADSAIQHMLAGATVLEMGSGLFRNPQLPQQIQAGLTKYLDEIGVSDLASLVGLYCPNT
jgi:dihydroorotate dehydrogenase (NAD+) catalytic subunit